MIREALSRKKVSWFRIVHFSVQHTHIHLLVEAEDAVALSRGMAGLTIRMAKNVNARLGRRGPFVGERYHARALKTPREVRNGLVYVLMNSKKHGVATRDVDPMSSAPGFEGFVSHLGVPKRIDNAVQPARTWLLSVGWLRHGLLVSWESPAGFSPKMKRMSE